MVLPMGTNGNREVLAPCKSRRREPQPRSSVGGDRVAGVGRIGFGLDQLKAFLNGARTWGHDLQQVVAGR